MIIAVILTALFALLCIRVSVKEKQRRASIKAEFERPVRLSEIIGRNAVVTDKKIEMEKIDIYSHRLIYIVTFLIDNNKTENHHVPEELFNSCNIGQRGTLATMDGEFFDFGNGEAI